MISSASKAVYLSNLEIKILAYISSLLHEVNYSDNSVSYWLSLLLSFVKRSKSASSSSVFPALATAYSDIY